MLAGQALWLKVKQRKAQVAFLLILVVLSLGGVFNGGHPPGSPIANPALPLNQTRSDPPALIPTVGPSPEAQAAVPSPWITLAPIRPSKGAIPSPTVSIGPPSLATGPPRGVAFNPEVFTKDGKPFKNAWLKNEYRPNVRAQVLEELQSVKTALKADALMILVASGFELDWPQPTQQQIANLVMVTNDANSLGLRVMFLVSTPCVVPNSAVPPDAPQVHVGGHKKGEVVNGYQLFWDVPFCGDDHADLAKSWYSAIIKGLEAGVANRLGIAAVELGGTPHLAFSTEMNVLRDDFPYLSHSKRYLSKLGPYLQSLTSIPIGVSTLPSFWKQDPRSHYEFLDHLLEAVPITQWDYIDITSSIDYTDTAEILRKVGSTNSRRVILSDFKINSTTKPGREVMQWHFDRTRDSRFGGWWFWRYRDDDQQVGLRARGYAGKDGGWRMDLVDAIRGQF